MHGISGGRYHRLLGSLPRGLISAMKRLGPLNAGNLQRVDLSKRATVQTSLNQKSSVIG